MSCQAAFENHVRARLETSFGKAVAMLILASASNQCNVSLSAVDEGAYERLCETIAADQRVIDMWGSAGADETLKAWKKAVSV